MPSPGSKFDLFITKQTDTNGVVGCYAMVSNDADGTYQFVGSTLEAQEASAKTLAEMMQMPNAQASIGGQLSEVLNLNDLEPDAVITYLFQIPGSLYVGEDLAFAAADVEVACLWDCLEAAGAAMLGCLS